MTKLRLPKLANAATGKTVTVTRPKLPKGFRQAARAAGRFARKGLSCEDRALLRPPAHLMIRVLNAPIMGKGLTLTVEDVTALRDVLTDACIGLPSVFDEYLARARREMAYRETL